VFKPNFTYTNKIVKNLTVIAEAKTIILNSSLVPKWEVSLRKEAILKSTHFSTAIEGNPLTMEEISALADGRNIMAKQKDKQEVLNYIDTLKEIPYFSSFNPLNLDELLKIHHSLTKETLGNNEYEGNIRNKQVYVGRSDGTIIFMPPKTEEVLNLINNFLEWFNSSNLNEIDPVIIAGLTHYELVRIHPFIDGNGRFARLMATLVLYKYGFDLKRFFTLDDYYNMNLSDYYNALKTVDQDTLDLTEWLEYFTDGVAFSLNGVKEKVIGISKNVKILKEQGQISLNERQMKIVEKIISEGKITNKDIRDIFLISNTSAKKETANLEKLNVIKREGKGRNTHYVLT
jgi:Fic family protein